MCAVHLCRSRRGLVPGECAVICASVRQEDGLVAGRPTMCDARRNEQRCLNRPTTPAFTRLPVVTGTDEAVSRRPGFPLRSPVVSCCFCRSSTTAQPKAFIVIMRSGSTDVFQFAGKPIRAVAPSNPALARPETSSPALFSTTALPLLTRVEPFLPAAADLYAGTRAR